MYLSSQFQSRISHGDADFRMQLDEVWRLGGDGGGLPKATVSGRGFAPVGG